MAAPPNFPAGGAAHLAALAPAPQAVAAQVTVTRVAGFGTDARAILAASRVVKAVEHIFPFDTTSTGDKVLPGWAWHQLALPGCRVNGSAQAQARFAAASPITSVLSDAAIGAALTCLDKYGAFAEVLKPAELMSALKTAVQRAVEAGDVAGLQLDVSSLDDTEAFTQAPVAAQAAVAARAAVPARAAVRGGRGRRAQPARVAAPAVAAVAAVAAQPGWTGPSGMQFLIHTSWTSFEEEGATLPFQRLSSLLRFLGGGTRNSERQAVASDARLAAERLRGSLVKQMVAETPSDSLLARGLPALLTSFAQFPPAFTLVSMERASILAELIDLCRYFTSGADGRAEIERRRLDVALATSPTLSKIMALFSSSSERLRVYDRLAPALLGASKARALPSTVLPALEPKVLKLEHVVQVALDQEKDGDALVEALVADEEREVGSGTTTSDAQDGFLAERGTVSTIARKNAFRDKSYLDLEALISEFDLALAENQVEALAETFASGVTIAIRMIVTQSMELRSASPLLAKLATCLPELLTCISRAQAFDVIEGKVPDEAIEWRWTLEALKLFCKGRFAEIEWLNGKSGALGLKQVKTGNETNAVPDTEKYVVEAALEEMRVFGHQTCVGFGYSAKPTSGFTFESFCDFQTRFVKFARSLGDTECQEMLSFASTQFHAALVYAGELFTSTILAPEPKDAALDYFLPAGCAYELNLNARREVVKPIAAIRRALPGFMPVAKATTLPGATAPSGGPSIQKPKEKEKGAKGQGKDKGGADKRKLDGPGGKSFYAVWLSNSLLMLGGGRVFDIDAIAKEYKLDKDKLCWPTLLTTLADPMEICSNSDKAEHASMTAAAHVHPTNWDLDKVNKKHGRPPTAAEKKKATFVGNRKGTFTGGKKKKK